MKRSHDFYEKINTKCDKKLFSSIENPPCPEDTQNGIVLDNSQNLNNSLLKKENFKSETVLAKPKDSARDSFRFRIASKLKTVLDGFSSQLQSISRQSDAEDLEKLNLQNFIHSAKFQISELLNRQHNQGEVSKDISSPKTSLKSLSVDPLQIQISLKLQDLLCKALDDRLLEKNVPNSTVSGNSIEEWQDLSHLLQDFVSSAKRKISFSLAAEKPPSVHEKSPLRTMGDSDSSCDSSGSGGILLLGDAEKAPDYLDLSMEVEGDSDADDPGFKDTDSEEEVVVLGEKKPTYQEITLDEEGEVSETVVEPPHKKKVRIPKDLQDLLYDCPKCEKRFRVESLLKFHVRMHSVVESHGRAPTAPASVSSSDESDDASPPRKSKSRKEKENKLNSKSSRQHKIQKHTKRKVKITS